MWQRYKQYLVELKQYISINRINLIKRMRFSQHEIVDDNILFSRDSAEQINKARRNRGITEIFRLIKPYVSTWGVRGEHPSPWLFGHARSWPLQIWPHDATTTIYAYQQHKIRKYICISNLILATEIMWIITDIFSTVVRSLHRRAVQINDKRNHILCVLLTHSKATWSLRSIPLRTSGV